MAQGTVKIKYNDAHAAMQALTSQAYELRKQSRLRRYAGPTCANVRANIRANADRLDGIALAIRAQL